MSSRAMLVLLVLVTACAGALAQAGAPGMGIYWGADPVQPDEVAMLQGGGWDANATVEVARLGDGEAGTPQEPGPPTAPGRMTTVQPLHATADNVKFLLPAGKRGLYACRVVAGEKRSPVWVLNQPTPWWLQGDQGTEATPSGTVRIFGRCLSFEGKARVALRPAVGKPIGLKVTQADVWSLTAQLDKVPAGDYRVLVHNGHGGPAGWRYAEELSVRAPTARWKTDQFSVTDFGAVANDAEDDTAAFQAAIQKASDNGGGVVYAPRGRFLLNDTLKPAPGTVIAGAGMELTELHWVDRAAPLSALIQGTNNLTVRDLAIYATNHTHGIVTDQGATQGAGNLLVTRVRMRLNKLFHIKEMDEIDKRRRAPGGDGIRAGGDNVQVTDCDLYVTGRVMYLSRTRKGLVTGNTLYNGFMGWYCLSGSSGLVVEKNRFVGGDNYSTGGGINCLDGSAYSRNVWFSHNTMEAYYGWDREAMTSDAGGGAYIGKAVSGSGNKVELAADHKLTGRDWTGAGVFLLDGKGAGQYRRLLKAEGRTVMVDRPWDVDPDGSTWVSITALQEHYMLVGNTFNDATIAIQFYGISIDHVVANNTSYRAGGFHNMGLNYHGYQPSWYIQYFDNRIAEGNGFCGPLNQYPPLDSHIMVGGYGGADYPGPLARACTMRRNLLENNNRLEVLGAVRDVLMERNTVRQSDVGCNVEANCLGVLLRENRFEEVGKAFIGAGADKLILHPAEQAQALLSSPAAALPVDRSGRSPILAKLEKLRAADPRDPATLEAVRACLVEAVQAPVAGASGPPGLDLLAARLGLELTATPGGELRGLLSTAAGGTGKLAVRSSLPGWSVPVDVALTATVPPGWQLTPPPSLALKPGTSGEQTLALTLPAGAWGVSSLPLQCVVTGTGFRLEAAGTLALGPSAVGEWGVVGPFASEAGKPLDPEYRSPEWTLDLQGEYDGAGGKVSWKPATSAGPTLDLAKVLGPGEKSVAYAVACVQAARPLAVSLLVRSDNGCRVYLNDMPLATLADTGQRRVGALLQAGENVLLAQVTNTTGPWGLGVEITAPPGTAAGDLRLVPAGELFKLAKLNPPPQPAAPAGELTFAFGVPWELVVADDFNRGAVGPQWRQMEGAWSIQQGRLTCGDVGLIGYNKPLRAPVRIEYEARAHEPTDLSGLWIRDDQGWAGGYFFGFGSDGNSRCKLMRNGEYVAESPEPKVVPDKWHKVIAQCFGKRVMLIVDGKPAMDYMDPSPLTDCDTAGLCCWGAAEFDNVRIYTGK